MKVSELTDNINVIHKEMLDIEQSHDMNALNRDKKEYHNLSRKKELGKLGKTKLKRVRRENNILKMF